MTQQQAEHSHLQLTSSMINSSQITSTDLRVGSWHRSMHLLQQQGRHLQEASSQHKQSSLKHDHHDCPCTVRCRRGWHLTLTGLHGCNSSRANRKSTQVQLMLKTTNALCNVSADDCLCFVHHRRGRQFRLTGLHSCSSKAGSCRSHWLQLTHRMTKISGHNDTLLLLLRKRCAMFPASLPPLLLVLPSWTQCMCIRRAYQGKLARLSWKWRTSSSLVGIRT